MAFSLAQLGDWDGFFYYGQNDLEYENQRDALEISLQPKRSLYYFNQYSCGTPDYENYPNAILLQIALRFDIANGYAYRNTLVKDGQDGFKDRRLAVSQTSISFVQQEGELSINVQYIAFADYANIQTINIPLGVTT